MALFKKKKEPQQERSKETIEVILKAVTDLIDKGDTEHLTTKKIAERAGVSIGSLYQYFPSKEAIFSNILELHFKKEFKLISDALNSVKWVGLDEALDHIITVILHERIRGLKMERMLFQFFMQLADHESIRTVDAKLIAELDRELTESAAQGRVRKDETTAFILFYLIRNTFVAMSVYDPELYGYPEKIKENFKRAMFGVLSP